MTVQTINTKTAPTGSYETLHLVEVDDYIDDKDERLKKFAEKFEGKHVRMIAIGGRTPLSPVPETTVDPGE